VVQIGSHLGREGVQFATKSEDCPFRFQRGRHSANSPQKFSVAHFERVTISRVSGQKVVLSAKSVCIGFCNLRESKWDI
jgi:hypothetical protein